MKRLRLAILISGRGSNMESLVRTAQADPDFPASPAFVISNRPDAKGIEIAAGLGIATQIIDHKRFGKDREAFERHLQRALDTANIDFVALAGFMRVLTPWFIARWSGRMINIHPSLLPKYPGLDTHARALAAGDTEAGSSVHWVSAGVDEGEIIAQARVAILPGDTETSLAARVLAAEHTLYPHALRLACARVLSS